MKVAEVSISIGRRYTESSPGFAVGFSDKALAAAEFERLKDILERREKRSNDLEKTVTINGINSFTCPVDEICAIGFADYAHANEEEAGVRDAFPNIFKK